MQQTAIHERFKMAQQQAKYLFIQPKIFLLTVRVIS